jgi:hypothetical protein
MLLAVNNFSALKAEYKTTIQLSKSNGILHLFEVVKTKMILNIHVEKKHVAH